MYVGSVVIAGEDFMALQDPLGNVFDVIDKSGGRSADQ
jgi:hypothetical protein